VKKKSFVTSKDKKDWEKFLKDSGNIPDKEADFIKTNNYPTNKVKKLDLHGTSISEANKEVKKFITESYKKGYKKLIIVTGKGSRSKVYNDPYRSKEMSILKYSVPDYIKQDEELSNLINKISVADIKDGGEGAISISLKN
tara:strand:- start:2966 stop:3388 length:423 start_codon:yes stop_codon:yes gene_type:complete